MSKDTPDRQIEPEYTPESIANQIISIRKKRIGAVHQNMLFPGSRPLRLTIRRCFYIGNRFVKVETNCDICDRGMKKIYLLKEGVSDELVSWVRHVISVLDGHHAHAEQAQAANIPGNPTIRVEPHREISVVAPRNSASAGQRIKLLPPGGDTIHADAPISRASEVGREERALIKIAPGRPQSGTGQVTNNANYSISITNHVVFRLPSGTTIKVTIPDYICERMIKHCRQSNTHGREVGGILYGRVAVGSDREGVCQVGVTDIESFNPEDSSRSHLHLSPESWKYIEKKESEAGYLRDGKKRLGWYHTHPTQGIFFSMPDHNFHLEFTVYYQFALVIDPRNMEAGLFYWENREQMITSCTGNFALSSREAGGSYVLPVASEEKYRIEEKRPTSRPPLSIPRSILFVALFTLLALYIYLNSELLTIRPDHACYVAFATLLSLILWDMGWFHPSRPIESSIINGIDAGIEYFLQVSGKIATEALRRPPPAVYKAIFIALVCIGAIWGLFKMIPKRGKPQHRDTVPASMSTSGAQRLEDANQPITIFVKVKREDRQGSLILELKSESREKVRVEYILKNDAWSVSPDEENDFFREALGWNLNDGEQSYLEDIQKQLGIREPKVNGQWNWQTRSALLNRLYNPVDWKGKVGKNVLLELYARNKRAVAFVKPPE